MRIAVTGIGTVCSAGRGPEAVLERLADGSPALGITARYPAMGLVNRRAGFAGEGSATDLLSAAVSDALAASGLTTADLVVGTSSGDVPSGARTDPANAVRDALGLGRVATLSVACASGTAAVAVASGWLEDGAEAVVAAGVDALTLFVHAGFSGLGALANADPRPFHADRDGLALGEGAAALVLEPLDRAAARGAPILAELGGVGLSCDALHVTAPDREGRGVADAILAALAEAGLETVDLVAVHGTGTRYNDAMEAHALQRVFGDRPRHVYGLKGTIGHLLGAAGAIECAVAVHALANGIWPPAIRDVDPELPWVPARARRSRPESVVVTSSAFGGVNAAVAFVREGTGGVPDRAVVAHPQRAVTLPPFVRLTSVWPEAPARAVRLDRYSQAGVWAIAAALRAAGPIEGPIGVVLTSATGCREADDAHAARLASEGAARISRLWFAATVPSAPAAEAAVMFDLRGPLLAFIGCDDAEEEARRLVRRGRAAAVVAVWCEAPDPDGPASARARVVSVAR